MHQNQYARHPPVTASSANNEQTNPNRTNNPRDRDVQALRTTSPLTQGSASSEDFGNNRQDQPQDNPAAQMQRLNQVIQNFHTKAALIILHSRVDLAPAYSKTNSDVKRVNKWFNIELDETDDYRDEIRRWRTCDLKDDRPLPLVIEVFLTTDPLHQGQRLVMLDEDGKRWDVQNALSSHGSTSGKRRVTDPNELVLERWTVELGEQSTPLPHDLTTLLPLVYKKSIVLFRSLFTYCNFLPAWKLGRRIGKSRSTMAMKIGYRIVDGHSTGSLSRSDNLNLALSDSTNDVTGDYTFGVTESPAGPFSVRVIYRHNCEFRVDDSEELLSSRLLGADDDLFQPSIRSEGLERSAAQEVGSLPYDRRQSLFERPELGHAYGSLGTFHQAGIGYGTSPISALRNAQDFTTGGSPPTPEPARPLPPPQQPKEKESSKSSLRAQAATRRSSFSFQPFKTPTLSASPLGISPLGSSPRAHVPVLGSLTEESGLPPPNAPALAARKPGSLVSEHAVASSSSSSPKPASVTRYSSSFSHRRARLSSGGTTTKTDDDQGSSGRGSATSSAQPGSGLMNEATAQAGSSGSMQEDDENIKDFLKLLENKKDLLTPEEAAADAATRRTAAALNRFHRMKDSNTALSDSMSSSLMLHRSSTSSSRQLSSVPPMVPATSASTSSSPGKPISPHTPHTPFAPSRLSAAYSQDDTDTQHHLQVGVEEQPPSPSDAATSDTAQARSTTNVPAIDIPTSPRPIIPDYRRSSSAQRQPLSEVDDFGDLYGMRSASMGAHERRIRASVATPTRANDPPPDLVAEPETDPNLLRPDTSPRPHQVRPHTSSAALIGDGAGSDSGSARSSAHNVYRSRLGRGGGRGVTPPQGSTSSFERTDRSGADSGSVSGTGSWRRRGSLGRPDAGGRGSRGSAEEEGEGDVEDEFLPFAMERSGFEGGRK